MKSTSIPFENTLEHNFGTVEHLHIKVKLKTNLKKTLFKWSNASKDNQDRNQIQSIYLQV